MNYLGVAFSIARMKKRIRNLHEDDLTEFVQAAIRADEKPLWFAQPRFSHVWKQEYVSAITKFFLYGMIIAASLNVLIFIFLGLSTLMSIVMAVTLGGIILRLCWIYYLGRRLVYVVTTKRLVFFLESAKPIEYKSYLLNAIGTSERIKGIDGYDDVILPGIQDRLLGVSEGDAVESLIADHQHS
ncbi:hypothetical protein [Kiloniella majae]|uniref:hypothetical protein n=1 Tax=Kiloniella majae TaxID=1938558 RepID=UPI000A2770E2|nr:hypothetical protein [Kiloniella majae]